MAALAITGPLADMFPHEVTVETVQSDDGFGNVTYASGVARSCMVRPMAERRHSSRTGQEYTTTGKILFAGVYGLTPNARITLPAALSLDPTVVIAEEAGPISDENGPHHDKVFF